MVDLKVLQIYSPLQTCQEVVLCFYGVFCGENEGC